MSAPRLRGDHRSTGVVESRMTTSTTSSLASPVDSGVALLDSDGDCTSASEVAVNEIDSHSLRDDCEANLPYSEIEDNRINHQLVTLGTCKLDQAKMLSVKNSGSKTCHGEGFESKYKILSSCDDPELSSAGFQNLENSFIAHTPTVGEIFPSLMTQSAILCEKADDVTDRMTQSCVSCIDLKTDNDSKNYALVTGSCDNIVFRKQRRKKRGGPDAKVKRVSFHEDIIRQHDSCSPSNIDTSKSLNRHVIRKARYSWCGQSESLQHPLDASKSNIYLSSSPDLRSCYENNKCNEENVVKNHNVSNSMIITVEDSPKVSLETQRERLFDERGMPEGQEDPPEKLLSHLDSDVDNRYASQCSFADLKAYPSIASSIDVSDLESMLSESDRKPRCTKFLDSPLSNRVSSHTELQSMRSKLIDSGLAYKTSILNRFMKSVAEKVSSKKKANSTKVSGFMFLKGLKRQVEISKKHQEEIEEILQHSKAYSRLNRMQNCPLHLEGIFRKYVFMDSEERLYKVFKVRASYFLDESNEPLLALLSDTCFYLTGLKNHNTKWYNHRVIPYRNLDVVVVGPNQQTLLLGSVERGLQAMIGTASREVTSQLMCHLDVAMRRAVGTPALPAVRELQLDDMRSLLYWLRQDMPLDHEDSLCHYSLVHLQDKNLSPPSTPLGPVREGHLMFRPATVSPLQPWEPGYFMLKGGVVYMFGDKAPGLPKRAIPLTGGHCLGCRRVPGDPRPYTFEIIIGQCKSFQFAAADEYEASDWLQAFVQSASGVYECERAEATPCSLLLTSQYVLTCRETFPCGPVHLLSCAAVADIVALGTASEDQSWCILEFVCREVHESSGDWVLYFTSGAEMQDFRHSLRQVWLLQGKGDLPVDCEVDPHAADRCWSVSDALDGAWDAMLEPP